MSERVLSLDFETACLLDITKVGVSRYTRHPSFIVTILAYAWDDGPIESIQLPQQLPRDVEQHIKAGGKLRGWNLGFEACVLENFFYIDTTPEQLECTQARAMYSGAPASLSDAGDVLAIDDESLKDKSARRLMLQMARPRVNKDGVLRWWHDEDKAKLDALEEYCRRDVEAERAIARVVPQLPEHERKIYELDIRINRRGVMFDMALVDKLKEVTIIASSRLNERAALITNGVITSPGTEHKRMRDFFDGRVDSFDKKAMPKLLKRTDFTPVQKELLELRAEGAKSSTAKLNAVTEFADEDGACRYMMKYFGAATGRFSAKGPQPHNLPRGSVKDPDSAINDILRGMDADGLSAFYGSPLEVVSSLIRGTIIPRKGHVFIGFDFSQIESRLTAYLCNQDDLVDVFRRGEDPYQFTSDRLGLGSRQAGKAATLGLGFGLGAKKFIEFAEGYGLNLTEDSSQEIVSAWRQANNRIKAMWDKLDLSLKVATRLAQQSPSKSSVVNVNAFTQFYVLQAKNNQPCLMMSLPTGRSLFYRNPQIATIEKFGRSDFEALIYSGYDNGAQIARQRDDGTWSGIQHYGGRALENLVQATARDLMCDAMLRIEAAGYPVTMSVHDEIVCEAPIGREAAAFDEIRAIMQTPPAWGPDLPIGAEGAIMQRFKK